VKEHTQDHGQGADPMTLNGDPTYASPNTGVVIHYLADSALRISNLRAPGKIANVFAAESFADEVAAAERHSLFFRKL
jgi:CO/xanthine dehydrogenase Mo-binding subunit